MRDNGNGMRVAVLAFDGMSGFTLGMVGEVFGRPAPAHGPWYDLVVCAESPGPVQVTGGASMRAANGLDEFAAADLLIVPGVPDTSGDPSPGLVAALHHAHRRGARVVSICSGAFALAAAGLLDGRRATTHWSEAELLRTRYPRVELDPDVLYVDDGDVLTGAGHAAGLDLCLHIVRKDHGAAVANKVARRLVVQPHRDGGQAQFIETPMPGDAGHDGVARSMAWALGRLAEPMSVAAMAAAAHVSPRTYLRHFQRATGTSPIRWLIDQRIRASLALLETTDIPIEEIAEAVGFETAVTYRHHFTRAMRISPTGYRRAFRWARRGAAMRSLDHDETVAESVAAR